MRARPDLLACGAALAAMLVAAGAAAQPSATRRGELEVLLLHDCGACHGMRLTGGLGPPITPRALASQSDETLTAIIEHGRPGTAMPPWGPLLSADEIEWLVHRLRRRGGGGKP